MPDKGCAMQVDRYNHLLFPRDATAGNSSGNNSNPAAAGKESAPAKAGGAAGLQAKPQPTGWGAQADARPTSRTESVVLKIQWPDGTDAKPTDIPLYTPGRRMPAAGDADTGSMAREHQLAVGRQADSITPIAVSKDGVLVVAKPVQAAPQPESDAQPDFVALAVSALREYRDDPERQRVGKPLPAPAPEAHWSALKGLQQIAAKLNVFA
jgi:hypothetical protein